MNPEIKETVRNTEHLLNLLNNRNEDVPNFALLIGAGASAMSQVDTGATMTATWRHQLHARSKSKEPLEKWLHNQPWFDDDDEYGYLFESIYDQAAQRRVYVESMLAGAHPSWGYVYLTSLLANRVFNVVFTTNFDDLLNEACYLYSDLRPQVAAFDSAISNVRLTSDRPKIIKLHGDFLYDNIKNTVGELETLEENTKRKFRAFCNEYGLIVVGYSGRDRSVMDSLDLFLRSDESFKHGVYWCIQRGAPIGKRLTSLLRRDRVYLVEIDGFDELMAEIHHGLDFDLPESLQSPFRVAERRARLFIDPPEPVREHPLIQSDIAKVLAEIEAGPSNELEATVPAFLLAEAAFRRGDTEKAIEYYLDAYAHDGPYKKAVGYALAEAYLEANKREELTNHVLTSDLAVNVKTYYLLRAHEDQKVLEVADDFLTRDQKLDLNHHIVRMNRAIALKRQEDKQEMEIELIRLIKDGGLEHPTNGLTFQAGVQSLRDEKEAMLESIQSALQADQMSPKNLREWPVFENWASDPDFQALVAEVGQDDPGSSSEPKN